MSSIVMDVCAESVQGENIHGKNDAEDTSATFVATTIFHFGVGAKTARCSSLDRLACSGNILACDADGEL